jgi:hypothetical protein
VKISVDLLISPYTTSPRGRFAMKTPVRYIKVFVVESTISGPKIHVGFCDSRDWAKRSSRRSTIVGLAYDVRTDLVADPGRVERPDRKRGLWFYYDNCNLHRSFEAALRQVIREEEANHFRLTELQSNLKARENSVLSRLRARQAQLVEVELLK